MESKKLNIILGIAIIILLVLVGYLVVKGNSKTNTTDSTNMHTDVPDNGSSTTPPNQSQPVNNLTSDQQQQVASWKTYTNSQFGFSFKYPTGYTLAENCSQDNAKPSCNVTVQSSNSKFVVFVNNPGSGWYSTSSPQKGTVNIGGITTDYEYGQEVAAGGPQDGAYVYLASFLKDKNQYDLAFEYKEAHPGVFYDQIIQTVISTFTFNK